MLVTTLTLHTKHKFQDDVLNEANKMKLHINFCDKILSTYKCAYIYIWTLDGVEHLNTLIFHCFLAKPPNINTKQTLRSMFRVRALC